MNNNNLVIIKKGDIISLTENTLNQYDIQYKTHSFEENSLNISTIIDINLWTKNITLFTDLLEKYKDNAYTIILTEGIYNIDKDKITQLVEWINNNSDKTDLINLECSPDFLCGDKNNKIVINSNLELYKNNVNLSNTGMILSKGFIKKLLDTINLDTDIISKIIYLKTNLKIYNTSPNLINSRIANTIQQKYDNFNIFHQKMQSMLLLSIITLALLLVYLKTKNTTIIYLILLYFALFLL